jgi:predicted phosphodiesterase
MKCKEHPSYIGRAHPISDCPDCWKIWNEKQMEHPSKLVRKMVHGQYTLKELGISLQEIRQLKEKGYRIQSQNTNRGIVYYVLTESNNNSVFISGLRHEPTIVRWVEMADIHCGSKQFCEAGLRQILQRAVERGFKDVHIAGDLHDGYKVYKGHLANLRYWQAEDQAKYLAEIFCDYDLNYYAIKGNHDHSYVIDGGMNPIVILQNLVPNFTFLDSFAGDMIILGVLKRMVHLDGGKAYAKSYPGQTYLRNIFDSQGEHAYVHKKKYRIRFLQLGHFHTQIAYESAGINITHPGNFQLPNDYTIRRGLVGPQGARFTEAVIVNGQVIEYSSQFIKPTNY